VIDGEFDTDALCRRFLAVAARISPTALVPPALYSGRTSPPRTTRKLYDSSRRHRRSSASQRFWPIVYDDDQIEWEGENWFEGSYTDRQKRTPSSIGRLSLPKSI
jgi:hypothetical protein